MPATTAPPWSIPYALLTDTADANVLSKSMADRLQVLFAGQANSAFRYDYPQRDANTVFTGWDGALNLAVGGWTKNGVDVVAPSTGPFFLGFNVTLWYGASLLVTAQLTVDGAEVARSAAATISNLSISMHGGTVVNLNAGQKVRLNINTSSSIVAIMASPQSLLFGHSVI